MLSQVCICPQGGRGYPLASGLRSFAGGYFLVLSLVMSKVLPQGPVLTEWEGGGNPWSLVPDPIQRWYPVFLSLVLSKVLPRSCLEREVTLSWLGDTPSPRQESECLLRSGQYAFCSHAGGLVYFLSHKLTLSASKCIFYATSICTQNYHYVSVYERFQV